MLYFKLSPATPVIVYINPQTAGVIGWISDSYCSIKPLCSGMGEVAPARTSPTLLPPSPHTVLSLSCFKVTSTSIALTSTVRVNTLVIEL